MNLLRTANYRQWIALVCIPLALTAFGGWACNKQQTIVQYVTLAVDTAGALTPFIPGLQAITPYLQTAQAGLAAWQPGQPIPANVTAALQAALQQAEKSFPSISPGLQSEIGILIAALLSALTIAGVVTGPAARQKAGQKAGPYMGKSPQQLRKMFNQQAEIAGVKSI